MKKFLLFMIVLFVACMVWSDLYARILGDVNGDNKVDMTEAVYALQVSGNIEHEILTTYGMVWKGSWEISPNENYRKDDIVQHNGSTYICVTNHSPSENNSPPSNFWNLIALKGEQGEQGRPFTIDKIVNEEEFNLLVIQLSENTESLDLGYAVLNSDNGKVYFVQQKNNKKDFSVGFQFTGEKGSCESGGGHSLNSDDGNVTDAVYVNNSGNVGIGTTSPYYELEVSKSKSGDFVQTEIRNLDNSNSESNASLSIRVGGSSAGDPMLHMVSNNEAAWNIGLDNSDSNKFKIGYDSHRTLDSGNKLIIDPSGKVGIGTTEPTERLEVEGIISTTVGIKFPDGTTQTTAAEGKESGGDSTGHSLNSADGSVTDAVYVGNYGNVGIGTTSPIYLLEVSKSKSGDFVQTEICNLDNSNSESNASLSIRVGGSSAGDPMLHLVSNNEAAWNIGLDNSDSNKFKIGYDSSRTLDSGNILIIDSRGKVGIGTTEPTEKLEVEGVISTTVGIKFPDGTTQTTAATVNDSCGIYKMSNMTRAQREDITEPSAGMMIYQTDNNPGIYFYNGTKWGKISFIEDNSFSVGGSLSGLSSGTVVLQNNDADDLTLSVNGNFIFATALSSENSYNVTIKSQPSGQNCTVKNGIGTISEVVKDIEINCSNN